MNYVYVVWSPHYGVDKVTVDQSIAHTRCNTLNRLYDGLDYRVERKVLQLGGND